MSLVSLFSLCLSFSDNKIHRITYVQTLRVLVYVYTSKNIYLHVNLSLCLCPFQPSPLCFFLLVRLSLLVRSSLFCSPSMFDQLSLFDRFFVVRSFRFMPKKLDTRIGTQIVLVTQNTVNALTPPQNNSHVIVFV